MANFEAKHILVNRMYIGSYLDKSQNIGHEIINLLKPDNA
jgi:hypothetical protein